MQNLRKVGVVCYAVGIMGMSGILFGQGAYALEAKPESEIARWSGKDWGIVKILPRIAKYGDKVHIHGMVVGGPASDPLWSCSRYKA